MSGLLTQEDVVMTKEAKTRSKVKVTLRRHGSTKFGEFTIHSNTNPAYLVIYNRSLKLRDAYEKLAGLAMTYEDLGHVLCLIGSDDPTEAANWLNIDLTLIP